MAEFRDPHLRTFIPSNRAERRAAARGKAHESNAVKNKSGFPLLKKWAPKDEDNRKE